MNFRSDVCLTLGASTLHFSPSIPALQWVRGASGGILMGAEPNAAPRFEVARVGQETLWSGKDHPEVGVSYRLKAGESELQYDCTVQWDGTPALSLRIYFTVEDGRLRAGFRDVREQPGFQLLTVRLPAMATVLDCQPGARLALPLCGGRLVDPATCPNAEDHAWPGWKWQMVAGIAYHHRLLSVVEVPGMDDLLRIRVGETQQPVPQELFTGEIGAIRLRRQAKVQGSTGQRAVWQRGAFARCASLTPELVHRAPSAHADLRFELQSDRCCYLSLLDRATDAPLDWQDAARLLRSRLDYRPPVEHRNTLLYGVYSDVPSDTGDRRHTFAQSLEDIRHIEQLTDGIHQNVKLIGWQHKGHDTGYPDTSVVHEGLGGEAGLRDLMKAAKSHNATIACHDNYQSAYKHSPGWDDDLVMRDSNGELQRGGVWAGGQLYLIHYHTYLQSGRMRDRLRSTYDWLPFAGTCYFDEMNVWFAKRDYRRDAPASGHLCLQAMKQLVAMMRERGILLMSEGFASPLAGHLAHGWLFQDGAYERFPHGSRIPLVSSIFHGHATYGGDLYPTTEENVLLALYHGRTISTHLGRDYPLGRVVWVHYLVNIPYLLLREREIERVEQHDTLTRVYYGPESERASTSTTFVEVDLAAQHYRVVVEGRLIAKDFSTFAPNPRGDAWLAYSLHDSTLAYPLPPGWGDARAVEAVALTKDGPGETVPAEIYDGSLVIQAPASTPICVRMSSR